MTGAGRARIISAEPVRPWTRPGSSVTVTVRMSAAAPGPATVTLRLLDVARVVSEVSRRIRLPVGPSQRRVALSLPEAPRHGYGVEVSVRDAAGRVTEAQTAVEALEGWWESPRHVALTRFRDASEARSQVASTRSWHVTVAQAYDWMYRHYQYAAPSEPFQDAMGREVSHRAVRALVREGHRAGIATLAYGSVYGAEPEYVAGHPDERVFDAAGLPLSLGGAFFMNDLRPGRPWRRRLHTEYERACRRFGFDGIHMDTYGPPHEAIAADGTPLRFAELYPQVIKEAAARVAATGHGRRVLFNCVEGFPLDAVADAPAAALYLELWPPDDRYADVVRWIGHARVVGSGRAVVIAAYVPALRDAGADPARRAAAVETAVLLTSVITTAGASHHALAEDDHVIVEGYYPAAVRLAADEARELRAAWEFGARYLHLLSDPAAKPVPDDDSIGVGALEVRDADGAIVPLSTDPDAGAVWVRATTTPAGRVLSFVDLRGQTDDRWTAERQACPDVRGWTLQWPGAIAPVAMSPWTRGGAAHPLQPARTGAPSGGQLAWDLPGFRRWLLVHDPTG